MTRKAERRQILKEAWIGDAVLALHVRSKILSEANAIDGPKAERMCSNRFLSVWADPSVTEAEIGRVYQSDGLEAAFRWIEETLMPVFEKQEANRMKKAGRSVSI